MLTRSGITPVKITALEALDHRHEFHMGLTDCTLSITPEDLPKTSGGES